MAETTIYAFTSAACNYLPKARLLLKSLKNYHPEIRRVIALSDQITNRAMLAEESWDEIISIDALEIPDWKRWAFTHDIVELSTAIKPFALNRLLEREDCAGVLYFDPDMVLFSRLDDLIRGLDEYDILLTPHQNKPETGLAEVIDNEICSLKHGIYNLGFIGVRPSPNGKNFARWWRDRVYYFCRADIPNGLFTDQRWIDLAPALFDGIKILRSSRFNVAPWNLTTRKLSGSLEKGLTVDGEPLGFYHFTGFDSGAHRIMIEKYCAKNAALRNLITWYEENTRHCDEDPLSRQPWSFGQFEDGEKINRAHRLIYRSRADIQKRFPDPFSADQGNENTYSGWCHRQGIKEYPSLLPKPSPDADWSEVCGLIPSIALPASDQPPLSKRLLSAATNFNEARLIGLQLRRVTKREGIMGLLRRIHRIWRSQKT